MGISRQNRADCFKALLLMALAAGAAFTGAALAQDPVAPSVQSQAIDFNQLQAVAPRGDTESSVIDFENAEGPPSGAGIALTSQYENSHGVTFGPGNSVHFCQQFTDDVMAPLCVYQQAASGMRVAAHDVNSGGSVMTMSFSRPVQAVSMRINPTGGQFDEAFTATLNGFNSQGEMIATQSLRFIWRQDAFTWPTTVGLQASQGSFARVTVELGRAAQNNQAVRFLIDDLRIVYGSAGLPPVLAALSDQRTPPSVSGADVIQSPETESVQDQLRLYPAATRIRTKIDWDAVQETLDAQDELGISAAPHNNNDMVDIAALPLLLPSRADPNSFTVASNRDSYHADFTVGGRGYSIYGTRVLTVITPAEGATTPAQNVKAIETEYSLEASFSLYGASYTLARYCHNDNADEDPDCYDKAALGDAASNLVAVVGAAGRGRP